MSLGTDPGTSTGLETRKDRHYSKRSLLEARSGGRTGCVSSGESSVYLSSFARAGRSTTATVSFQGDPQSSVLQALSPPSPRRAPGVHRRVDSSDDGAKPTCVRTSLFVLRPSWGPRAPSKWGCSLFGGGSLSAAGRVEVRQKGILPKTEPPGDSGV